MFVTDYGDINWSYLNDIVHNMINWSVSNHKSLAKGGLYQDCIPLYESGLHSSCLSHWCLVVDLYLVHSPIPAQRRLDTWKAMEEILRSGKAKAIGVSNYGVHHLKELFANCKIRPSVNQVSSALRYWCRRISFCHKVLIEDLNLDSGLILVLVISLSPLRTKGAFASRCYLTNLECYFLKTEFSVRLDFFSNSDTTKRMFTMTHEDVSV